MLKYPYIKEMHKLSNTLNEFDFEYTWNVDSSMTDSRGNISPAGLQRICVNTIEHHLVNINLSVTHLMENYGLSWILLSLTTHILSPIKLGDELVLHTRHTNRKGVIYRRDIEFMRNGEVVAIAVSFSSILDIAQRRICTDKAVLDSLPIPCDSEPMCEAVSRHKVKPEEFAFLEERAVRPSWIDPIGHVNNLRYSEFIHDALPKELEASLESLKCISVYFTGELKKDDRFSVLTKRDGNDFEVMGIRLSDEKPAFSAKLSFE